MKTMRSAIGLANAMLCVCSAHEHLVLAAVAKMTYYEEHCASFDKVTFEALVHDPNGSENSRSVLYFVPTFVSSPLTYAHPTLRLRRREG